jgi:hypothetical protein
MRAKLVSARKPRRRTAYSKKKHVKTKKTKGVYVLQLQDGFVYVGKSGNIGRRAKQHVGNEAAAFTRIHKPSGKFLKRLGNLRGSGDGPERDETLRWMHKLGPEKVRGWKYVRSGPLLKGELAEIESNIRELFDLCRTCGKRGHFATRCPLNKNFRGKKVFIGE